MKFINGQEQSLPIHDLDIRQWALKGTHEHRLKDFKAPYEWLHSFQCKYNVVSHKIANIVKKRMKYKDLNKISKNNWISYHQIIQHMKF